MPLNHHKFCAFFFYFCSAFHFLIQWTHWPPFLKCGQMISGYLLELEILLVFNEEDSDCCCWDFTEAAYSSYCLKLVFYTCNIYNSSAFDYCYSFNEFNNAVSSAIYWSFLLSFVLFSSNVFSVLLVSYWLFVKFTFAFFNS